MNSLEHIYKDKTVIIYCKNKEITLFNLVIQKAYNKFDIIVNITVCTHFNLILKSANMNYIETCANCYIDTISS